MRNGKSFRWYERAAERLVKFVQGEVAANPGVTLRWDARTLWDVATRRGTFRIVFGKMRWDHIVETAALKFQYTVRYCREVPAGWGPDPDCTGRNEGRGQQAAGLVRNSAGYYVALVERGVHVDKQADATFGDLKQPLGIAQAVPLVPDGDLSRNDVAGALTIQQAVKPVAPIYKELFTTLPNGRVIKQLKRIGP